MPTGIMDIRISNPLLEAANQIFFSITAYGLFVVPAIINFLQLYFGVYHQLKGRAVLYSTLEHLALQKT
jgi:hypothetical protein